jgi:hypothetical protein
MLRYGPGLLSRGPHACKRKADYFFVAHSVLSTGSSLADFVTGTSSFTENNSYSNTLIPSHKRRITSCFRLKLHIYIYIYIATSQIFAAWILMTPKKLSSLEAISRFWRMRLQRGARKCFFFLQSVDQTDFYINFTAVIIFNCRLPHTWSQWHKIEIINEVLEKARILPKWQSAVKS